MRSRGRRSGTPSPPRPARTRESARLRTRWCASCRASGTTSADSNLLSNRKTYPADNPHWRPPQMPTDVGISHANRNLGPAVSERTRESGPQLADASRTMKGVRTSGSVGVEERAGVGNANNGASVGARVGADGFAGAGVTKDGHVKAVAVGSVGASVDATANGRVGNDQF